MITVIQIHNGALLIGEIETMIGLSISIQAPRVIRMQDQGGGQVSVQFLTMLGDPKEVRVDQGQIALHYEPDDGLMKLYREAVTGLTLATKIPDGGNIKQFPGGRMQ